MKWIHKTTYPQRVLGAMHRVGVPTLTPSVLQSGQCRPRACPLAT